MASKLNFFIEQASDEDSHGKKLSLPDQSLSRRASDIELHHLARNKQVSRASSTPGQRPSSIGGPTSPPGELEATNPPPHQAVTTPATSDLPSIKYPYMNRWRLVSCCIGFFTQGLTDSATGAVLPYMQGHYRIGYAIVSMIFVANAVGFVAAAPFVHILQDRFGRSKVLASCGAMNVLAYVFIVCQPPFPVVVVAFLLLGES